MHSLTRPSLSLRVLQLLLLSLLVIVSNASPTGERVPRQESIPGGPLAYAPKPAFCPSTPLVRTASGLGSLETAWLATKKTNTDAALATWLKQFGTFKAASMPNIASAVAGGYLRASLLGAGIHQQLDGNEGKGPMAGLLQAIQYETTLSGSAAYQAGLMQNNWPSIASLSNNLWQPNYAYGQSPGAANGTAGKAQVISEIVADCGARSAAGFAVTEVDIYGRIIGYSNLYGPRGGVSTLMSGTRDQSQFINAQVPFPIMTAIGTIDNGTKCTPGPNGTQYELTPFEFGSWDQGVAAFMDMKYLGTKMLNGKPASFLCTDQFDNLGLMVGTTANTISKKCMNVMDTGLESSIQAIEQAATFNINRQYYAAIPNPFFMSTSSPLVANETELALVDGGNSGQVIPLWPLLNRPSIDVTMVWDNYYDAANGGTTGGQIFNTYNAAKKANLVRMPTIPNKATFKAKGLNTRPYAFGCNNKNVQTFIYVPYVAYIPQTQKTGNLTTTPEQTRDYVLDGNLLATYNGNSTWPQCVGCLIMKKAATSLPSFCSACFKTYCYN